MNSSSFFPGLPITVLAHFSVSEALRAAKMHLPLALTLFLLLWSHLQPVLGVQKAGRGACSPRGGHTLGFYFQSVSSVVRIADISFHIVQRQEQIWQSWQLLGEPWDLDLAECFMKAS